MKIDELKLKLKNVVIKLKSDKKAVLLVLFGAIIMLAVVLVDFSPDKNDKPICSTDSDYENELEEKLCSLVSNINGAGRVKVMLTFESTGESVFACDSEENVENKGKESGNRKIKNEYIILKNNGDETGLQIKDVYPKVRGAAIVCDGAADPIIKGQIISVVSALFDINSTDISVAEMAD